MKLPYSTALVTGGAGFIGSHLVDRLLTEGANVTVLDNFAGVRPSNLSAHKSNPRLRVLRGDITDAALVKEALRGAEVVFHEAAMVDVQRSMREPDLTYRVNVEGTRTLLEAAVDSGARKFLLASSAAVYGDSRQLPRTEDTPLSPLSPYAASKVRAEALLEEAHRRSGMGTTSLRYFNTYGARSTSESYSGVINVFAQRIIEGGTPTIYGDGSQSRDFVAVSDVVEANLLAASSGNSSGRVFNVGTGIRTTILDLALMIFGILRGRDGHVEFKPFREGDVKESYADISRIRDELGFVPKTDLSSGLAEYLNRVYRTGGSSKIGAPSP